MIVFPADSDSLQFSDMDELEDTFNSCVYVSVTDDNIVEGNETVSVEIDDMSLMPNDDTIEPRTIAFTIIDNDGKCYCCYCYSRNNLEPFNS